MCLVGESVAWQLEVYTLALNSGSTIYKHGFEHLCDLVLSYVKWG